MAWYYGTYYCGHEGRVNIVGPHKYREYKIDRHFEGVCEECLAIKRAEENEKAINLAKEMDLVELKGSEKQVGWANTLRNKLIDDFDKFITTNKPNEEELAIVHNILDYILITTVDASDYIDMRFLSVFEIIKTFKDKATQEAIAEYNKEKEMEESFKIYPEQVTQPNFVRISYIEDKVKINYERNEDFKLIVKKLGYDYESCAWTKKITATTGSHIDRIAEIGNALLASGFIVLISNDEAREKAKTGTFEKEHKRWITRENENTLKILWKYRDENLYFKARSLPKSKYRNGVILIDVCYHAEVEDFANLYDFKFTDLALDVIENYKEELKNATKVENIKVVSNENTPDELDNILNSSRDVLTNLIEED